MTTLTLDSIKDFLKKQNIIVKEFKPLPTDNDPSNIRIYAQIKAINNNLDQKDKSKKYNLMASIFELMLDDVDNKDKRKIFSLNNKYKEKSWVDYLINKDIAYAEGIREKSDEYLKFICTNLCEELIAPTTTEVLRAYEFYQTMHFYAINYMNNFAKQIENK